jgi:hypothetical protein
MHTRALRPYELARDRPRRIFNLTQKHGANPPIEAIPSMGLAANQVVTGMIYQHSGAGGGADFAAQGINTTPLSGILASEPFLTAPLAPNYGQTLRADAAHNYDKGMLCKLERQNSPLIHGPGVLQHIWEGSSFAGSSSTVSLRATTFGDIPPPRPTRPRPAPAPAPPAPPGAVLPVAAPSTPAPAARIQPPRVTSRPRAASATPPPSGRIPGTIAPYFYRVGTTFLRT